VTSDSFILVTGGAGYIGSHVVLALSEAGHALVVIDDLSTGRREAVPDDVELVVGDVADEVCVADILARHPVEAVMHFAGSVRVDESVSDPLKYYRNNSSASRTLIEACVAGGVKRFVFSSTAAAYGIPDHVPVDETTPLAPINPYGHSKVMTEQVLRDTAAASALNYAILRYFNVAGADPAGRTGQATPNATHLIKVACEVATGARRKMEIFGTDYDTPDGTCVRDYIHVSDLADAHVRVLDWLTGRRRNGTFNCGYGRGYSVREVLAAVEKAYGRELAVSETGRRAGDSPELVADSALIRRETGWTPRHDDLDVIVGTALEWERKLVAA
jgi:UDP-glucose 4-epimerase